MSRNVPNLLEPSEVAEVLGISVGCLKRWRLSGQEGPPALKLGPGGRVIRYDAEALREWLQDQTDRSAKAA